MKKFTRRLLGAICTAGKIANTIWCILVVAAHIAVIVFGIRHDVHILSWLAGFGLFYMLVMIGHYAYLFGKDKDSDK